MHQEKYGFVYVWRDKKRDMYYVGCHWGLETDKYVCSSTRMRNAYNRRKDDFKRRVVQRVYTNRLELLAEEHKWMHQIKDDQLGKKFYNLSKKHCGHWTTSDNCRIVREKISLSKKGKPGHKLSDETKAKLSKAHTGKVLSEEHTKNLAKSGTWNNLIHGAWNRGIPHSAIHKKAISESVQLKFADGSVGKKISNSLIGRTLSAEHRLNISKKRVGKRWVTDGAINILIAKYEQVPDGFRYGLTK